jgi:hypothetical protein
MRYLAIAAGLAFAISTMPVLGPAWAQFVNPQTTAPLGGGGGGGGNPGYPDPMINSFGKCWINTDKANYRWGDCPAPHAAKGGHHKKG